MDYGKLAMTPVYRNWSQDAIYCYERGCNCEGCPLRDILERPCLMKYAVISLVKNVGKPKNNIVFKGGYKRKEG